MVIFESIFNFLSRNFYVLGYRFSFLTIVVFAMISGIVGGFIGKLFRGD